MTSTVLPGQNEVVGADIHRFAMSTTWATWAFWISFEFRLGLCVAVDSGIVTIVWCSDCGVWTETDVPEDGINGTSSRSKSRCKVLVSNSLTSRLDTVIHFISVVESVGSISNTNHSDLNTILCVVWYFIARLLVTSWFTIGKNDSPLISEWVNDISLERIMSPHRKTFLHSSLDER